MKLVPAAGEEAELEGLGAFDPMPFQAYRSDEREHIIYQRRQSFDLTVDEPTGAVGEETLPFGVEYRAAVVLREVNAGYFDDAGTVAFGPEGTAIASSEMRSLLSFEANIPKSMLPAIAKVK